MTHKHNPDQAMAAMLKRKGVWPLHAGGEACPDAATLAAFFERSLTAAETSRCEMHISSCARCQEQLAALARSEPVAQVTSAEGRKPAFSWFWDWRVLAPAGAAAVVVLAFSISQQTLRPPMETKTGRDVTSPAPPATALEKLSEPAAEPKLEKGLTTADESRGKKARADEDQARANLSLDAKQAPKSPALASKPAAVPAKAKPDAEENQIVVAAAPAVPPPSAPGAAGVVAPAETAKSQRRIVEADRPQAAQTGTVTVEAIQKQERDAKIAEQKEQARAADEVHRKREKATGRQEGAATEQAPARFGVVAGGAMTQRLLMAPAEFIVVSPNPKILWRFGPAGLIQRSRDSGKTWQPQKSPVKDDFLSGSSPAEKICWVGGKNGILLRTTDAGENWELIPSPTHSDILSIKALDHLQVTVTDAAGRSHESPNAGRLWRAP